MSSFKVRSQEEEAMDDLSLSKEALAMALRDIRRVNVLLGGHKTSLKGIKPYLTEAPGGKLHLLDIGCGNGEFLRYLANYCRKKGIAVSLTGWDMNAQSLEMAEKASSDFPEIRFEVKNVLEFPSLPDQNTVISCNLFLHHFTETQISSMLAGWLEQGCRAIVVNDLHRNKLAYYLFRLFGAIFMRSAIARSDGAISIRRGFLKKELSLISKNLPTETCNISWKWAFRYLWVLENSKRENL